MAISRRPPVLSQREMTSETTPYNFYIRSILEQIWACSIQRAILRTTPSFFLFRTHWIWRNLVLKTPTSLPSSAVRAALAPARDQRLYPDGRGHSALRLYPLPCGPSRRRCVTRDCTLMGRDTVPDSVPRGRAWPAGWRKGVPSVFSAIS